MNLSVEKLRDFAPDLRVGDRVLLSGYIYTARDAAHKRMVALMDGGSMLPFELTDACIYYAGPTGAPFGLPIGSIGPTTAGRMDPYTPRMLDAGVAAMIGKGERSEAVKAAIVRNKSVYFSAIGGAGALAAMCVDAAEVIAFPDLGCEAVRRLLVRDFPLIVAIDVHGGDIYAQGRTRWSQILAG
jgi:fumarate hydratase subunit beta